MTHTGDTVDLYSCSQVVQFDDSHVALLGEKIPDSLALESLTPVSCTFVSPRRA